MAEQFAMVDSAIRDYFSTRFRTYPAAGHNDGVCVLLDVTHRTETRMSIVETLQRPVDTNDSAKTRGRVAKRQMNAAKAKTRQHRAATPSLAELQQQRDRAIEEQAKAMLRTSAYHPVRHVYCEVRDGVLILRGRVPSFYIKQMAQTVVRHLLEGSLVLDNQLEVDCTQRPIAWRDKQCSYSVGK